MEITRNRIYLWLDGSHIDLNNFANVSADNLGGSVKFRKEAINGTLTDGPPYWSSDAHFFLPGEFEVAAERILTLYKQYSELFEGIRPQAILQVSLVVETVDELVGIYVPARVIKLLHETNVELDIDQNPV